MYKFLLFIFIFTSLFAETPIFILNSYHQDYSWTEKQNTAFSSVLNSKEGFYPLYSIEHLDTKRREYDKEYEEEFVKYMCSKYKGYQPELIYVTDDNALNFMLQHKEKFFPSVPVIFSGINDLSKRHTLDERIFTGVFEDKEIIPNIKLIKKLFPQENEILLLGNINYLDLSYNAITSLPAGIGSMQNLQYLDISNNRITELPKEIGKLKRLTHLIVSANDLSKLPEEVTDLIPVKPIEENEAEIKEILNIKLLGLFNKIKPPIK